MRLALTALAGLATLTVLTPGCTDTSGETVADTASALGVCNGSVCDGKDPATAAGDTLLESTWVTPPTRKVVLHVSYPDDAAWGSIEDAAPGDEVWVDRSFDAGKTWDPRLGDTLVPGGWSSWRTLMYVLHDPARGDGQIRACGRAAGAATIRCTGWLPVCNGARCDGADPAQARSDRAVDPAAWVWWRRVLLHVSDVDGAAWASVENGEPGDEVWVDRSWNGGDGDAALESHLGDTITPPASTAWRTWTYQLDDHAHGGVGSLRACGQAAGVPDVFCTPWARSSDAPVAPYATGVADLSNRLATWSRGDPGNEWWWAANAVTSLIDYVGRTGPSACAQYWPQISAIYRANVAHVNAAHSDFQNDYYDDTAWWALAWIRAAQVGASACNDFTPGYVGTAADAFVYLNDAWDTSLCDGGIWWMNPDAKQPFVAKNTIANELFLKLAAELYEVTGDVAYRTAATRELTWLEGHWVHDAEGLIEDDIARYDSSGKLQGCGGPSPLPTDVYTYTQGVVLGGLASLYRTSGNPGYLTTAKQIAAVAMKQLVTSAGVLYDPCDATHCDGIVTSSMHADESLFKGVFVRNLRELADADATFERPTFISPFPKFLRTQRTSIQGSARSGLEDFGYHWAGPIRQSSDVNLGTQTSGVDAFNAAWGY